jgi:putative copper export protein
VTLADYVALALRAAAFVAMLQAAGTALFVALYGRELTRASPSIAAFGFVGAGVAVALTVAQQIGEPARLAGSLRGVFDADLQQTLLFSPAGAATAVRLAGLAALLFYLRAPRRVPVFVAFAGTALIATSFALLGHTTTHDPRGLLGGLLIVHVAVVAFWFGALAPLRVMVATEDSATAGRVLARFSRHAARLVPTILIAGLTLAWLLLPSLAAAASPFGALLAVKIAGFAGLMALAAANKWRLAPRVASGDPPARLALQRSIRAEWALIVAMIVVTVVLTGVFAPHG